MQHTEEQTKLAIQDVIRLLQCSVNRGDTQEQMEQVIKTVRYDLFKYSA